MTTFEARFLNCLPDPEAGGPSPLNGLALSPGPLVESEPLFVCEVRGIEEYSTEQLRRTLAAIDGVSCLTDGPDTAYAYRWSCGDRTIDIIQSPDDFLECDGEAIWLGSRLIIDCTFADLVRFWNALRARHPAVWLFNSQCRMFTPQSFLEECALPDLCRALADVDTAVRERAGKVFAEYAALAEGTRRNDSTWRRSARHMSDSVFSLGWPVIPLCGSVRPRPIIKLLVQLDQALAANRVPFCAYPTARGNSPEGIALWVPASRATSACSVLRRLGLIPKTSAEQGLLRRELCQAVPLAMDRVSMAQLSEKSDGTMPHPGHL